MSTTAGGTALQTIPPAGMAPRTVVVVQATSEIGGSDVYVHRLVSYLDRKRYRTVVVLPRPGPLMESLREAGAEVVVLPLRQLRPVLNLRHQAAFLAGFLPSVLKLARLIRARRAAVVHSKSLLSVYGPLAAALARTPNVQHLGELPEYPRPVVSLLTGYVRALSARVVTSSEAVARGLFGPPPRWRGKVVPLVDGIEVERFRPDIDGSRLRAELGLAPNQPLVAIVSRLDPWKGVDVFLRAAAVVAATREDVHFVVWGGSLPGHEPHGEALRRLAGSLGLGPRLTFAGWAPPARMPEVMAAIDVLVHTSVRPEPLGLVLVEAMAAGKPVVASKAGGVLEIVVEGETGHLVEPGDVDGVAGAIQAILDDPERARAMGAAGRRRAEAVFGAAEHARRMEQLYDEVAAGR